MSHYGQEPPVTVSRKRTFNVMLSGALQRVRSN
jgi:hypothetical protein